MNQTDIAQKPPIPNGFSVVDGTADSGLIIKRDADGSEFVWVPAAGLPKDGTLGKTGGVSFGFRPYGYSGGTEGDLTPVMAAQAKFVEQYGGFYISRYCLSRDEAGNLHSVPNAMPLTNVYRDEAERLVAAFIQNEGCTSHLPYAAEMDTVLAWALSSGTKTRRDVTQAAAIRDTRLHDDTVTETASNPSLYFNGIYDLAGTVDEWTQDSWDGGHLWGCCRPCGFPDNYRCYFVPYPCYKYAGMRAVLSIQDG